MFDKKIIITAQKDIVMGQENHIPKMLRKWHRHLCECQQDLTFFLLLFIYSTNVMLETGRHEGPSTLNQTTDSSSSYLWGLLMSFGTY